MNKLSKVIVNSDHNLVTIPVRFDHGDREVRLMPFDAEIYLNTNLLLMQEAVEKRAKHCLSELQAAQVEENVIAASKYSIEYINKEGIRRHFVIQSYNEMVGFLNLDRLVIDDLSPIILDQILKALIYLEINEETEDNFSFLQSILSGYFMMKLSKESQWSRQPL